jgi:hypothetical protein
MSVLQARDTKKHPHKFLFISFRIPLWFLYHIVASSTFVIHVSEADYVLDFLFHVKVYVDFNPVGVI